MIDEQVIESTTGDFYLIKDKIIIGSNTTYLSINLKNSKVEMLKPFDIHKFINLSNYLYINGNIIINSDDNIIKELSNKINFKTSFNIKKDAKIEDILNTEILIEDVIHDILFKYFNIYIHDEISTISKVVSSIKINNSASSLINI